MSDASTPTLTHTLAWLDKAESLRDHDDEPLTPIIVAESIRCQHKKIRCQRKSAASRTFVHLTHREVLLWVKHWLGDRPDGKSDNGFLTDREQLALQVIEHLVSVGSQGKRRIVACDYETVGGYRRYLRTVTRTYLRDLWRKYERRAQLLDDNDVSALDEPPVQPRPDETEEAVHRGIDQRWAGEPPFVGEPYRLALMLYLSWSAKRIRDLLGLGRYAFEQLRERLRRIVRGLTEDQRYLLLICLERDSAADP